MNDGNKLSLIKPVELKEELSGSTEHRSSKPRGAKPLLKPLNHFQGQPHIL